MDQGEDDTAGHGKKKKNKKGSARASEERRRPNSKRGLSDDEEFEGLRDVQEDEGVHNVSVEVWTKEKMMRRGTERGRTRRKEAREKSGGVPAASGHSQMTKRIRGSAGFQEDEGDRKSVV